jgi:hypothetical protein
MGGTLKPTEDIEYLKALRREPTHLECLSEERGFPMQQQEIGTESFERHRRW